MFFFIRIFLIFVFIALFGGTVASLFLLQNREAKTTVSKEDKELQNLPKSILHYPSIEDVQKLGRERAVVCHLDEKYDALIAERKKNDNVALAATGKMGADILEIYAAPGGTFFAIVKGLDAAGHMEACEVAAGEGWAFSASGAPPAAQTAPVPAPQ